MYDDRQKSGKNSDRSDVNFLLPSGILENLKKMKRENHNTKKAVYFPTYQQQPLLMK